jgi:hypothetical protein
MRIFAAAVCAVFVCAVSAHSVAAQSAVAKHRGIVSAAAVPAPTCSAGARLALSGRVASEGSVLLARLTAKTLVSGLKASWDGREAPFWQESGNGSAGGSRAWAGLLAVDLEKTPGTYTFELRTDDGGLSCSGSVRVIKGLFPTERLTVEKQFVEPNPEQAERAKAEGEKWSAIVATVTPKRLWTGAFRLPLDGVTTGGNFGRRRILNGQARSPHSGVDFPVPTGTPVHASQAGKVVLAEPLFFAGNTVIVDHGLGVYTFYLHLSAFAVKAGDSVEEGTVLGQVGATGRVTGPHLHWGVTIDRERVNGMDLVKVMKGHGESEEVRK